MAFQETAGIRSQYGVVGLGRGADSTYTAGPAYSVGIEAGLQGGRPHPETVAPSEAKVDVPLGMDTLTPYPDVLGSAVVTPVAEAEDVRPSPETPVVARAGQVHGGTANLRDIICAYSWDCPTALSIVECESRFRSDAIGEGSYGLMQLQAVTWVPVFPEFWERWMEPEWNVAAGYEIYERAGGWSPWSCWR